MLNENDKSTTTKYLYLKLNTISLFIQITLETLQNGWNLDFIFLFTNIVVYTIL